jgi:energy-coupling factor transporter ATP-binding protein EcfA2
MLLSFRVSNHRSLRDEQHLNLAPAFDADRPAGTDWPAVPVVAILGANASGKSNLIDALAFLRRLILRSDREGEPGAGVRRSVFALDPVCAAEQSWYDIDAVIDGVRHSYGFGLDDDRIVEEWLHRYPHRRKQVVFERKGRDYKFGTTIDDNLRRMVDITPDRVLFISSAARFEQADVLTMYRWVSRLHLADGNPGGLHQDQRLVSLFSDETRRQEVRTLLQFADLGISDIRLEDIRFSVQTKSEQSVQEIIREFRALVSADLRNSADPGELFQAPARQEIRFAMKGAHDGVTLGLDQQSAGTATFLRHLPDVLDCLHAGRTMVVDELESNLHPTLARHIVGLFQDSRTNPNGAQLIFTTHNTSLLGSNNEWLKRDQVWFVEKDHESGASSIYPLTDFKPRNKENTERRYLGGGYGAVPFIDEDLAVEALSGTGAAAPADHEE